MSWRLWREASLLQSVARPPPGSVTRDSKLGRTPGRALPHIRKRNTRRLRKQDGTTRTPAAVAFFFFGLCSGLWLLLSATLSLCGARCTSTSPQPRCAVSGARLAVIRRQCIMYMYWHFDVKPTAAPRYSYFVLRTSNVRVCQPQ